MGRGLGGYEGEVLKLLREGKYVSVEEAARSVAPNLGISVEEVTRIIYILWKEGYIDVINERALRNFLYYFFSLESVSFWILVGYSVLTSLIVLLVSEPPLLYLRYILGVGLVLYVPGAVLIEVLYPSSDLEPLERFSLSIGLSLAIVPFIGLILNYTPLGIRLEPVLYSIVLFSIAAGFVALVRKYRMGRVGRFT